MRVGLISDVHANLFALRTALATLRAAGVDRWVCAGDLIGYGPHPNECVDTIAALDPVCVAGNHELLLLGEITDEHAGRRAVVSLAWTRGELRPDIRAYLAALPRTAAAPSMIVAHGSLDDPEEYVVGAEQAADQLRRLAVEHQGERLLVLGHTHHQWVYGSERGSVLRGVDGQVSLGDTERVLVNPGSVGQSRDRERTPLARFGLIDLDRRWVRLYAEPYDDAGCRRALRERGLLPDSHHIRPGKAAAVSRRARRLLHLA